VLDLRDNVVFDLVISNLMGLQWFTMFPDVEYAVLTLALMKSLAQV